MKGTIKFIDLFAGIGGIRCGLELAAHEAGYKTECVFTSEIKKHAIKVLRFKREFPCLQAGDDSVSFRLSFGLQYIFLLFLPIYDQRTLQNRILSRGMVNDYATMEIRSAGRRMNIPSTD